METVVEKHISEKSLLEKYQKDFSKDSFIIKKGERARKILQKAGYPVKS